MDALQSLITHEQRDNGIHEVVFLDKSREAAAQLMEILEAYCGSMAQDDYLRVLVDFRQSGIPPLNYSTERGRALIRDYPERPNMRIAYLSGSRFAAAGGSGYPRRTTGTACRGDQLYGDRLSGCPRWPAALHRGDQFLRLL